jgi:hypothetical protein
VTVRTFLLAVGCAVAVVVLMAAAPPRPKIAAVGASFVVAPDSTVTATVAVSVRGTLQPGDMIRYKVKRDGVFIANELGSPPSRTFASLPAPAYGATSVYHGCARVQYANGSQGLELCSTTGWSYTRPMPPEPPAEVESVEITPASFSSAPGQATLLTATVRGSF